MRTKLLVVSEMGGGLEKSQPPTSIPL